MSWASDLKQAFSHCPGVSSYSSCSRTGSFLLLKQEGFSVPEEKYILFGLLPFCQFSRTREEKGGEIEQELKHGRSGIMLCITKLNWAIHIACNRPKVLACLSGLGGWKEKKKHLGKQGYKFESKGSAIDEVWVARGLPISAYKLILFHITTRNKLSSSDIAPYCGKQLKLQYTKWYPR